MDNKRSQQGKVAVVTGSSSGIGFETSLLLARKGFNTYATMRNLNKSQKINDVVEKENLPLKVLQLDVTHDKSVKDAIRQITDESSRIDVLVNNAGYGVMGAVEDLSLDEFKSQFETNFFGAIRTIQQVLRIMRSQRAGCSNTSKRLQNEDDNQLQILYELFSDILEANARFRNCDQL